MPTEPLTPEELSARDDGKLPLPPMPPAGPSMTESACARRAIVVVATLLAVGGWIHYKQAGADVGFNRSVETSLRAAAEESSALIWAAALTSVWVTAVLGSFLWSIRDALHRLAGPAVTKATRAP